MANNNLKYAGTDQNVVLCKYFVNGVCSKNESCTFSHDKSHKPSMTCTFYKNGHCSYGSSCRYDHVKANDSYVPPKTKSKIKFKAMVSSDKDKSLLSLENHKWVNAPEFIPGQQWMSSEPSSYSSVVQSGLNNNDSQSLESDGVELLGEVAVCEYCFNLYDINDDSHEKSCISSHEEAMKEAFLHQVSSSQVCGICLEVVWNKLPASRQRFGILSGCDHVFCLECIRKWRGNEMVDEEVLRLCPQCRVRTNFIIPSHYWFETKEDKEKLIDTYKASLRKKPCKYFVGGGFCPFMRNCFYSHTSEDGQPLECLTRFKKGEDGSSLIIKTNKLSDFFEYEQSRRTNLT